MTLLRYAEELLVEQQRRFARLLPRRPGEHPVHFDRATARLDAADAAVTLAKAAPSRELAKEAHRAASMAEWAVSDIAEARFQVEREAHVLARRSRDEGTRFLPIAAE